MLYLVMVTLGEGDFDRGVKEKGSVIFPSPFITIQLYILIE